MSGRCYWEVDFDDSTPEIGVTYADILRKADDLSLWEAKAQLGINEVSWSLGGSFIRYHARHDSQYTDLPTTVAKSGRIGVFLDQLAGMLSFYSVSSDAGTLSHLHTFQTTFRNPLYPAFCVQHGSLSLCKMD